VKTMLLLRLLIVLCACIVAASLAQGFAQSQRSAMPANTGGVSGRVVDAVSGEPIADLPVELRQRTASGERSTIARTNASGRYTFSAIPAGQAKLIAVRAEIEDGSLDITLPANGSVVAAPDLLMRPICPGTAQRDPCRGTDYALIIDSSGSMSETDPQKLRNAAAKAFVGALKATDRVTIVEFDDQATVLWRLQSATADREQLGKLLDLIDTIDEAGGTDISGGIKEAYQQLNDGQTRYKAAVLLTDGAQDDTAYDEQWEQQFQRAGWPIYTFGLDTTPDDRRGPDEGQLKAIAELTGGSFTMLAQAAELPALYTRLRTRTSGNQQIFDQQLQALLNTSTNATTYQASVFVPPDARVVTFVTSALTTTQQVQIQAPDGSLITPDPNNYNEQAVQGGTFELLQVSHPVGGQWRITVLGAGAKYIRMQADVRRGGHALYLPLQVGGGSGGTPQPTAIRPTRTPQPSATSSPTPSPTVTALPQPTLTTWRIDVGSDQTYKDSADNEWLADVGLAIDGTIINRAEVAIENTNDQALYRTERYNLSGYNLPVTNGVYTVRLHFAELANGLDQPGKRVFTLQVEQQEPIEVDITRRAGAGRRALVIALNAVVQDGTLNISFIKGIQNTKIDAIEVLPQPNQHLRVDAGASGSYLDASGNTWTADVGFVGGKVFERPTVTVADGIPNRIYQTERYSMTNYLFPVTNGIYAVRLHLSEVNAGLSQVGKRVFSLNAEQQPVVSNIDIVARSGGGNKALVLAFTIPVTDGLLDLQFIRQVENTKVDAIEIFPSHNPDEPLRIDAGTGGSYRAGDGRLWTADVGFVGGNIVDRGNIVVATDPTAGHGPARIYQTERWAVQGYQFPLTNGRYQVVLHFAETANGIDMPAERIFAIDVEGTQVEIDVLAITGSQRKALTQTFTVNVLDGQLDLRFSQVVQNPMINGIEVIAVE
jgi:Mg-chelatase subunit ChlD